MTPAQKIIIVAFLLASEAWQPPWTPPRRSRRRAQVKEEDLTQVPREELETMVRALRAENAALRQSNVAPDVVFGLSEAALLAGFAFESYNAPIGARWERGATGIDVAYASPGFVRECVGGALILKVKKATHLPDQKDLPEVALTGSRSDPYVTAAVIESMNGRDGNATDVARTRTLWRKGEKDDVALWDNEEHTLFVRDLKTAKLSLCVMDEDVASADDLLGAAVIDLSGLVPGQRKSFVLDLKETRHELFDARAGVAGAVAAGAAGLATGGVALVAIAAAAMSAAAQPTKSQLHVDLTYVAFNSDADVVKLGGFGGLATASAALSSVIPFSQEEKKVYPLPRGASPEAGVDWRLLCEEAFPTATEEANYEQLCFIDHRSTGTQAGIWRDEERKKLLVAFRGTSEPRDIVTDASAVMTPWSRAASKDLGDDHDESVPEALGDPRVHAGFRFAADSVAQRLKQLLLVAARDSPSSYDLELTGHSLGGALASLFALDVAGGVDTSRALPVRPRVGRSWFDPRSLFYTQSTEKLPVSVVPKNTFRSLSLVTFGGPRAGDGAFAAALDGAIPRSFRVVNDQDIIARLPRGFSYNHAGRTVLVAENTDELWVEGRDDGECPLKLTDAARRDANLMTSPLAEGSALNALIDKILSSSGDKPTAQGRKTLAPSTAASSEEALKNAVAALFLLDDSKDKKTKDLPPSKTNSTSFNPFESSFGTALSTLVDQAIAATSSSSTTPPPVAEEEDYLSKITTALSAIVETNSSALLDSTMATAARIRDLALDTVATPADLAALLGVDRNYAQLELKLLSALATGDAIKHHLEPAYFAAITRAAQCRNQV